MDIKLQQLRNFLAVVEHSGFRTAAAMSNKTQAGLSLSIKSLEQALGKKLFETNKNAKLTDFGKECLPQIQKFLQKYEDLETFINNTKRSNYGRLRISCVPSVLHTIIPPVLEKITEQYNNIEFVLFDNNSVEAYADLTSNQVDIAIASIPKQIAEDIVAIPLLKDELGIVCSKQHCLAKQQTAKWQELQPYNFIENGICRLLKATPANILIKHKTHTVHNILSLLQVLRLNMGVTILPKTALPSTENNLVWLPLNNLKVERQIYLMHYEKNNLSPQVASFIKTCQEVLKL